MWLAIGVLLVATLVVRAAAAGWYALAVLPFLMGALGYFQSRDQTCVFFAAVGQRDLDGGAERITDPAELLAVRAQARRVWTRALAATAALMALAFVARALTG